MIIITIIVIKYKLNNNNNNKMTLGFLTFIIDLYYDYFI